MAVGWAVTGRTAVARTFCGTMTAATRLAATAPHAILAALIPRVTDDPVPLMSSRAIDGMPDAVFHRRVPVGFSVIVLL